MRNTEMAKSIRVQMKSYGITNTALCKEIGKGRTQTWKYLRENDPLIDEETFLALQMAVDRIAKRKEVLQ